MKSILPVLNCCAKDHLSALYNLRLCAKLDGQRDSSLLLSTDTTFAKSEHFAKLQDEAVTAFKHIQTFFYTIPPTAQQWPLPQNLAWQSVARYLNDTTGSAKAWFWWEPDCVPLCQGWLDRLTEAYRLGRKPFAGVPLRAPDSRFYLNGCAIYPTAIVEPLSNSAALYVREFPFDQMAGHSIARSGYTDLSKLITHHLKATGGGPGRSFHSLRELDSFDGAVLFHGCTDLSLQRLLLGEKLPAQKRLTTVAVKSPTGTGRSTFYHSGDLGDIIYSLPTVRELGGGDLHLGPDNRTNMSCREKLDEARFHLIAPLLEAQPYLHTITHSPVMPSQVAYDLNQMRQLLRTHRLDMQPGFNLARCYLRAFGLSLDNDGPPWLSVPSPIQAASVVIARSPRYHSTTFAWPRLLSHYRGQCIFVGLPSEHAAFEQEFGRIPYHPTHDLLELAQVIAGCEVFAGNQSCPFSIAEALKKPVILEPCPSGSNTLFKRSDAIVGCTVGTTFHPLRSKPIRPPLSRSLTVRGPIDYFTGLGRITCQIIEGFTQRKVKVAVQPTSFDERLAVPETVKKLAHTTSKFTGPTLVITPLLDVAKTVKPGDTVFTMWESTVLPPGVVQVLNSRASLLIVPSSWCATVFSANGVTVPIRIVPLGVDTSIYKPKESLKLSGVTTFGAAGRTAHGGSRKGLEDVITAFHQAFPKGSETVALWLKVHTDCQPPPLHGDERILLFDSLKDDVQMSDWYAQLDCFISASKAEGWGLHAHEALSCGIPVIAPRYSGLADLPITIPLAYTITEATEGYSGHWCQPSLPYLTNLMKTISAGAMSSQGSFRVPTVGDMLSRLQEALS